MRWRSPTTRPRCAWAWRSSRERLARADPHAGRHRGRAQSLADPRRGRPEPVRDGAAVPVPRLRRRDPAAARGARRARSARARAQALRQAPAPAQEGDAIAARLVTIALQHAVTTGTGRPLIGDGLGRLQPAGKTGTSNDSRDSWFAGYTGDHLAVVWVGNDQNKQTGLYGATGAMRVWSDCSRACPARRCRCRARASTGSGSTGGNSTDAGCPGARRCRSWPASRRRTRLRDRARRVIEGERRRKVAAGATGSAWTATGRSRRHRRTGAAAAAAVIR